MQFSPWQFNASLPQGLTWATPQPQALLTQNHPIFIRGELLINDNYIVKIIVRNLENITLVFFKKNILIFVCSI